MIEGTTIWRVSGRLTAHIGNPFVFAISFNEKSEKPLRGEGILRTPSHRVLVGCIVRATLNSENVPHLNELPGSDSIVRSACLTSAKLFCQSTRVSLRSLTWNISSLSSASLPKLAN